MNAVKIQTQEQVNASKELEVLKAAEKERMKQLRQKARGVSIRQVKFVHKKTGKEESGLEIVGVTSRPIFLYAQQALRLFGDAVIAEAVVKFVNDNKADLSWKE